MSRDTIRRRLVLADAVAKILAVTPYQHPAFGTRYKVLELLKDGSEVTVDAGAVSLAALRRKLSRKEETES